MPRVSVIIPVRDRAALLEKALDALAAQEYRDFEVVVIDDGSTAPPSEVVGKAHGLDVRLIRNPGSGAVAARIAGVGASTGAILAFTDSDCRPATTWLKAGVAAIDAGAHLVHGPTVAARTVGPLEHTVEAGAEGLYPTCNLFVTRDAYDAAGGFIPRRSGLGFGEDTVLAWRVIRMSQAAAFADDALVVHAVLPVGWRESLSRARLAGLFPALVNDVPELRTRFLMHGVFLGTRRVPLYAAALGVLGRSRRLAVGGLAWWLASRALDTARRSGSTRKRIEALPVELAADVVTAAALVTGSARSRSVVL